MTTPSSPSTDIDALTSQIASVKIEEPATSTTSTSTSTSTSTTTDTTSATSTPPNTTSRTGLVYDTRCLLHAANYAHVESPARLTTTHTLLHSLGYFTRCQHITATPIDTSTLLHTHPLSHVNKIDDTANWQYGEPETDSEEEDKPGGKPVYNDCKFLDSDTYVNQHSSQAARVAIGGLITLCEHVMNGTLDNGFAIIRPPGHHAESTAAQGFCLYNNVAIAAHHLRHTHPNIRIAIIDWDVHHGNGTQSIFQQDPNVLYFSIHRHQSGAFYPHTGAATDVGSGPGTGFSVNMPLNTTQLGDREYLLCWDRLLLPILTEFAPDLIIVSAGFDCALGDPLGGMEVSSECFAHLTHKLQHITSHHRIVLALEGGYNVRALSEGVAACVGALLGDPLPELPDNHQYLGKRELSKLASKHEFFLTDLQSVIDIQSKYWKCLIPFATKGKVTRRSAGKEEKSVVVKREEVVLVKDGTSAYAVATSTTTVTTTPISSASPTTETELQASFQSLQIQGTAVPIHPAPTSPSVTLSPSASTSTSLSTASPSQQPIATPTSSSSPSLKPQTSSPIPRHTSPSPSPTSAALTSPPVTRVDTRSTNPTPSPSHDPSSSPP